MDTVELSEEDRRLLIELNLIVKRMGDDLTELKGILRQDYVSRAEFEPVKQLVYGLVGLILTAVVGGLLTLVLK